jgi:hypothetical protein
MGNIAGETAKRKSLRRVHFTGHQVVRRGEDACGDARGTPNTSIRWIVTIAGIPLGLALRPICSRRAILHGVAGRTVYVPYSRQGWHGWSGRPASIDTPTSASVIKPTDVVVLRRHKRVSDPLRPYIRHESKRGLRQLLFVDR